MAAPNKKKKSLRIHTKDALKPKTTEMKSSTRKNKIRKDSSKSESLSLPIEDDEPDFPRGGKSILSRREEEEIRAEVDAEFEAEERASTKMKKRLRRPDSAEEGLGFLFGGRITGKLPRFANRITLKNISPGMKLLGIIMEVNLKDLVISLPGGLRGYVRAEEASDLFLDSGFKDPGVTSLCDIFFVGQLVSCIVLQVDEEKKEGKGRKKIWLSLRLALLHRGFTLNVIQDGMVLTASVKSVEDHGYILHFGLSSFSGFLPKKKEGDSNNLKMSPGQLIQGVVNGIDKERGVVYLNSDPDLVSKFVIKDLKGLSLDLLVPGMMVNARVHSTLENGIMLSFLTYFTGTVGIFHLQNSFPNSMWKNDYDENKKVVARILFIDPLTRAVGLTMNSDLVHNKAPPLSVKIGDIYDNSRIIRVDKGLGLLLEVPSSPLPTPTYVAISDVADEEVRKLEKKFPQGSCVRVRVIGFRHLEGLAMGVLKASAFEGPLFTHADVKPGMVVKAKVIAAETFGAIVQLSTGVKALCPLPHMSEFDIAKPSKKFKVGAELLFRVLGCKSKRITVTHKKSLVKSKLAILASYADAKEGLVTHGWITKIEKHGCFVRFYNGVQGFAHRSELGQQWEGHVGQVVKCRIISGFPASRRINLSFIISPKRVSGEDDDAKFGSVVSGVVEELTHAAVIVHVNEKNYMKGTISNEHLADHQGHASLLKSLLKPGYKFDQLLVLDSDGSSLILSAKYSLINSAKQLPQDISQLHPHSVAHGYICNSIATGCFVRYLGHLTGFSPKTKATEDQSLDLSEVFYLGQSVRSYVLNVDGETDRITVSLKQSTCFSTDASFIQGYFLSEEEIAKLQLSESINSDVKWVENFGIGSVVEGEIQEITDVGVVLSFRENVDLVGFIAHHQLGGISLQKGSTVRALVLDIAKADGLVDLSLKPEFFSNGKDPVNKKRQREAQADLELHQTVSAVVEIVKENYLILSIPACNYSIGFASIKDYNTQKLPGKHFVNGQSVVVTIEAFPSPSTSGRLLLLLKSLREVSDTSSSKRAKKKSSYNIGSLVQAEITDIKPLELRLKFGIGSRGRVHITEVCDDNQSRDSPFSNYRIGQVLTARIVAKAHSLGKSRKGCEWELSVKPSLLSGTVEIGDGLLDETSNFSVGKLLTAYVVKVDNEWVRLTVSRHVKAQLFILDCSCEPTELEEFKERFTVGQAVSGTILSIDKEKRLARLMLRQSSVLHKALLDNSITLNDDNSKHIVEGDVLGGRIAKVFPGIGGLLVQIGHHLFGKVHFSELTDMWVSNPLDGYHEGQFVKCSVLEISRSFKGALHVDLSLRSSLVGTQPGQSEQMFLNNRFEKIEDLCPNMDVQGYVKNVTSKGCFIMLSRKIDAKILLSNLSDGYIENPENEFPVSKLVNGKVLSVEPLSKRVEVTLKTVLGNRASKSDISDLQKLHDGDVVSGNIRRIEPYGLFINIDNTNTVGLCHISELSDNHIENIEGKYGVGERVVAKILKVDSERHRVSLGMKNSYLEGDADVISNQNLDEVVNHNKDENDASDEPELDTMHLDANLISTSEIYGKHANGHYAVLSEADSRASVPPLEVTLDDLEGSDLENVVAGTEDDINQINTVAEKNHRREKKKEKEERELAIRAAEGRLLEKDIPRTADEFEKLVRSSPNSSFVWIKYMAFMLSMGDVEKARMIAERALQTINIREEGEKMNIWVAYFNLENEYGRPPEEAVMKIFQRALQYCDPKKLHLALLGMYERTSQHKLADELLNRMTKKFKNSCKVWLRRFQNILKQGKDEVQPIVNRALMLLPHNKHIKFISQTAILEFKYGLPDRGRSMFEGILREYPKRTDLWSIYLDQEIRLGDADVIHALFERATCLSLPPKKMKFLFKKYLEYEKSHGEVERIEYVKRKAMEYVESSVG